MFLPLTDASPHAGRNAKPLGRVLLTGGTGFLGGYILQELVEKGYEVVAIRHSQALPFCIPKTIFEQVEWHSGDVLDLVGLAELMPGIDAVIHAAGKVSFLRRERKEMAQTNIEGTANLVNLALEGGVRRFIHVSSVAALGRSANGTHVQEGYPLERIVLNTHYARSKFLSEMEVWRAIGEGLPAAIVNPSTILGYGDWNHSSCAIFKHVYEESPWYSKGVNGFVDVEDVARAIVLLMESDISGERFILSAENRSFQEIMDLIADGFSRKHPRWNAGPLLSRIAWRWEYLKSGLSGKPPLLTQETARIARSQTYFENDKMLRSFPGFGFRSLSETISRSCQSYLDSLKAAGG
jgi:dihydroflavonol-4-reductase